LRAGRLRHQVVVQQPDPTVDTYGQPVRGWATVATVWAAVEPLNGREFFKAQEVQAETRVRMRLRYGSEIASISQSWRVTFSGKVYNILSVIQPAEIDREIILMCGEGVNDGD